MLFQVFDKTELARLFDVLSYSYVIGPKQKGVNHGGEPIYDFAHLEDFSELSLDYPTTAHSPKRYFLPHHQVLARYSIEGCRWTELSLRKPETPVVFFGMHACDINALNRLDRILLSGGSINRHYASRRRNTFIVGVSCDPSPQCFCSSMGCDTVLHGCDMFMTDIGDEMFCEIRSAPAYEVMKEVDSREADSHSHSLYVRKMAERSSRFAQSVDTTDLIRILDMEFEAEVWQEWGRRCLSCGTCANVCPTCYCYGTEHLIDLDFKGAGKMMRLYSCNVVDFAEIAGGHNFRPGSDSRMKYRYYHKHRGFVEAFEESLCVGCGRCGRSCLAGITVPDVIRSVREEAAENG